MKRLVLAALLVLAASTAFAGGRKEVFDFKGGRHITVVDKGEFVEITTDNNTLRVYPCGEVKKLTWSQLNPNEDAVQPSRFVPWVLNGSTTNAIGITHINPL